MSSSASCVEELRTTTGLAGLRPWRPFRGASPSLECGHSHKCGGGRCSDFCYGTCRADGVTTGRAKEDRLAATWMNGTQRAHASPSPRRSRRRMFSVFVICYFTKFTSHLPSTVME